MPLVAALYALGVDRFDEWLAGGLELTEVAVAPDHRRRGVGTALQRAVVTAARNRGGWTQLSGSGTDGTVLLDNRHPASQIPEPATGRPERDRGSTRRP